MRKTKTPVSKYKKDDKYYTFRKINNERAAKCRENKRQADMNFYKLLNDVEQKNKELKQTVNDLKEQLDKLVNLYLLKQITCNDTLFFNSIIINNLI